MRIESNELMEEMRTNGWMLAQELYIKFPATYKNIKDIINKHGWKMQNYIYTSNSEKLSMYLLRLYSIIEKNPKAEIIALIEVNSNFKKYAISFLSGFICDRNDKYKNNNQGVI